jgi:hypothetical protein
MQHAGYNPANTYDDRGHVHDVATTLDEILDTKTPTDALAHVSGTNSYKALSVERELAIDSVTEQFSDIHNLLRDK